MSPKHWLLLALLSLCWGSSFALNEKLLPEMDPITIVWSRQCIATLLFFGFTLPDLYRCLQQGIMVLDVIWRLLVMGVVAIAVPFSLFAFGQQYISSALAGIGNGTVPLFTMLWATWLLTDERMNRQAFVGLTLGFCGLSVLFVPLLGTRDFASAWGMLLAVIASAMYGFANTFARSVPPIPLMVQALGINLSALIVLTPAMLWFGQGWSSLTVTGAGYTFALAFLGSFAAYSLYLRLIRQIGAVNTSQVAYLLPFSALTLGVFWLGETITVLALLGFALVILGLWVKDRSQKT